ncbi:TPA: cytochrome bc complex cytochrome b subunit [Legionella pneumophila]|uniref:Cytochrome b n=1 Tax=Legionella pneumophila subsp. pneumophila TaxID=91891 RepID=A0AAV2UZF2_LEGPN|nr:cytochrome b N-terminal domain-containing protein [Legionella pneumophila]MCK1848380.1 cytochrome b N-terminal domain-containing protein [Legionella pneumophila]MCZ4804972.1 cytochrome b N-terminal domain-containing protein [Legionella pneumophila]MDI9850404.1 cytochrome b N-terminal domain-containing protein [Legionella pneumophila]MDW8854416.1 cytochrome b N-terminal domain-containing protein [Legionella pneumophila]MDW8866048.1 cytochrome b N-terminal domain-containing protein [Legionell
MNGLVNWLDERFPLVSTWKAHFSNYYAPKNFNFLYFFGSLALIVLVNQIITGLWLTMFYTPNAEQAFSSVEFIMRDINFGWLLRYMHSTGASAFFIVIYLHMFRGLLYGSYQKPRELVWLLGMFLYLLLMAEAFFGYLLPWGQMSYWGAEVITSLFGAIPYIGKGLAVWLRGDYSVANPTLQRFFALHVIGIPILMIILVFLHIVALHKVGSNNPEGIDIKKALDKDGKPLDGIPFHPYYTVKDFVGIIVFSILFFAVVFFAPEMGGYFLEHANFVPANPMVTPDHIAPVWYLAPFYAILRAIPDKLIGVVCMAAAILLLFFLPWLDKSNVRSVRYKGMYSRISITLFAFSFLLLGYLGTTPVTPVRLFLARIAAVIYFSYFILMPIYSRFEKTRPVPTRIGEK